jgi:hypothetical protein
MAGRRDWVDVDMDGLRKILERRGKELAVYELVQNAWDENVTKVEVTITRPENGRSELVVTDDSPEGFRDLTDSYTMFAESYKKADPDKRGAFNLGEKYVLALCDEATITTTTGRVTFDSDGRRFTAKVKRERGSEFRGSMRLKIDEWEQMCAAVKKLIPPVPTFFNGTEITPRKPLRTWTATLPTVKSDSEGNLRPTERQTTVSIYRVLPGETAMLYEMGIPVVEIKAKYHVSVGQKVPLNIDRDNVTPAYLKTIYVELLNHSQDMIGKEDANEDWVRKAASDPRCSGEAIKTVLDLRFGENRVGYDPSDIGSNREAASQNWTVVTGGSMSAGEWDNAKRAGAIAPAGNLFPTNHGSKVPDKTYSRDEWTPEMLAYASFVERVSPMLVGRKVTVEYIRDRQMVCGQFFHTHFMVNLAQHSVDDWQENIELMLHELAHDVVKSNDHLVHQFYDTVGCLGAKLSLLAVETPELFGGVTQMVAAGKQQ